MAREWTPMWIEGSEVYSDSNSRRVVINSSGSRFKSGTHAAAARPINEVKCVFPVMYVGSVESFRGTQFFAPDS